MLAMYGCGSDGSSDGSSDALGKEAEAPHDSYDQRGGLLIDSTARDSTSQDSTPVIR